MTRTEWETFEKTLLDRGYKKWVKACYGEEDFDISKMVRNGEEDIYQLIFRFWDIEQFKEGAGYSEKEAEIFTKEMEGIEK